MRIRVPHWIVRVDRHIVAASIAANVLAFALPLLMLQIYDRIIPRKGLETLTVLALGVFAAIVLEMVLRTARAHLMALAGDAYERRIQKQMFERLLKADLAEIEKQAPGVYLDSISGVDRIRDFRNGETAMAALDLPFVAVFLTIVAIISPILAAVVLLLVLISLVTVRHLQSHALELSIKKHDLDRRRFSFLIEVLSGIESIKSFNLEPFMERRYERLIGSTAQVGAEATRRSNFVQAVTGSIGQVTPVVVAAAGAILVMHNAITIGALAAVILLGTRIVQPVLKLEALQAGDEDTQRAETEIARILEMPLQTGGDLTCPRIEKIELRGVNLAPKDRLNPLFRDLNLTINRGEIISIDGANGTGRSSLLWLIMGYFRPDSGSLKVNGVDIGAYAPSDIRGRFAYLPPRPKMLEGTVLDNMTCFEPEKYLDDALEVGAALGLEEYFATHQEGLSTRVGHGLDAGLPTSVAERVPLVGALVGRPDVVLFDEANANLDMDGDRRLREYIASLKGHAAVVLVTQRPSYIALADHKYRIVDGQLRSVEQDVPAAGAYAKAAS